MSRHFIVDGYNLLHATPRWEKLSRLHQREAFLKFLEEEKTAGSPRNSLTVVLDGYSADLKKMRFSKLRLVFSEDVDADTAIKRRVADLSNPREAVVVTNDRAIQEAVKGMGAQVMGCAEFLAVKNKRAPRQGTLKMGAPGADAITRELKRLWCLE